ncbi:hypothetical protein HX89_11340 [Dermacoccus nishinomiyaensis]|uniref:Uncharacterized protein n=2 Tax=Dermacoccaceae TaxID=145357 RepID=A0A075JHP8_9MICO|nr:hypothetical protein HX89_11340 [Dermacoccus nishinomiyaensis]
MSAAPRAPRSESARPMSFSALAADSATEHRLRRRRLVRNIVAALVMALVVFGVMRTWHAVTAPGQNPHVATKTVTLIAAEPRDDGVHVRARLDAPSVDATSHELEAVIPTATWNLTHALWACYPPNDPARGSLRTPLDPGCVYFVDAQD